GSWTRRYSCSATRPTNTRLFEALRRTQVGMRSSLLRSVSSSMVGLTSPVCATQMAVFEVPKSRPYVSLIGMGLVLGGHEALLGDAPCVPGALDEERLL